MNDDVAVVAVDRDVGVGLVLERVFDRVAFEVRQTHELYTGAFFGLALPLLDFDGFFVLAVAGFTRGAPECKNRSAQRQSGNALFHLVSPLDKLTYERIAKFPEGSSRVYQG